MKVGYMTSSSDNSAKRWQLLELISSNFKFLERLEMLNDTFMLLYCIHCVIVVFNYGINKRYPVQNISNPFIMDDQIDLQALIANVHIVVLVSYWYPKES